MLHTWLPVEVGDYATGNGAAIRISNMLPISGSLEDINKKRFLNYKGWPGMAMAISHTWITLTTRNDVFFARHLRRLGVCFVGMWFPSPRHFTLRETLVTVDPIVENFPPSRNGKQPLMIFVVRDLHVRRRIKSRHSENHLPTKVSRIRACMPADLHCS